MKTEAKHCAAASSERTEGSENQHEPEPKGPYRSSAQDEPMYNVQLPGGYIVTGPSSYPAGPSYGQGARYHLVDGERVG